MDPISDAQFAQAIAASALQAKYGTTVDHDSAHERITARITAARAAAAHAAAREEMSPTTNSGLNRMTPAQQRREIARQAREIAAARRAAERERKAQAAAARRAAQERARAGREQQRMINTVIRGVFGVLGGRRR
jgi:hypothetical protein